MNGWPRWAVQKLSHGARAAALLGMLIEPGGRTLAQVPFGPPTHARPPSAAQPYEDAEILARIGTDVVLAGDLSGPVDALMEENRDQIPPDQWATQRRILMQQALEGVIETRLILVDAMQKIPADALPQIREQIDEAFEDSYIKPTMKKTNLSSRAELDAKLKETGSSLARQKERFFERSLAMQWVRQQVRVDAPVAHEQIMAHYQAHLSDYDHPARARWEQLSVRIEQHASRDEALRKIAAMGNDILSRQSSFADVARRGSDGPTSEEGGQRDWTTRGALVSKRLDQAIFTLPVGRLSTIIEDRGTLHIVRVIERELEHRTSFRDAQVEIEEKLKNEQRTREVEDYYARLRKDIRVWTVFDDPATSRQALRGPSPSAN